MVLVSGAAWARGRESGDRPARRGRRPPPPRRARCLHPATRTAGRGVDRVRTCPKRTTSDPVWAAAAAAFPKKLPPPSARLPRTGAGSTAGVHRAYRGLRHRRRGSAGRGRLGGVPVRQLRRCDGADRRRRARPAGPDEEIADFVGSTYQFDRVVLGPVDADLAPDRLTVTAPGLDVAVRIGGPAPLDRLLRLVPGRLATAPWWLRAIDPVAARIVAGVHTAGSAGNGRREYYGVRRSRQIVGVAGSFAGQDLGAVAPLLPPVGFGFSSAPPAPPDRRRDDDHRPAGLSHPLRDGTAGRPRRLSPWWSPWPPDPARRS